MVCKLPQNAADALWPAFLAFRSLPQAPPSLRSDCVFFFRHEAGWRCARALPEALDSVDRVLVCTEAGVAELPSAPGLSVMRFDLACFDRGEEVFALESGAEFEDDLRNAFRLYLPILLGADRARRSGKSFVIAHIAQSLDGRIACNNGHSQWISNQANLFHAHRLRALCDAVLVGARTVHTDDPKLTVRHVEGPDPVRVVLNGSASLLDYPQPRNVFEEAGCVLACATSARVHLADASTRKIRIQQVRQSDGDSSRLPIEGLCAALRGHGISSIFVEGGASTVSQFLESEMIDLLHVHVAPLILGSGVPSIQLPEVQEIQEGRRFRLEHFEIDHELLFECRCLRRMQRSARGDRSA